MFFPFARTTTMDRDTGSGPAAEDELRQACADLEYRLREGKTCTAEAGLAAHPSLSGDADAALEVIYTEYGAREQLGQRPVPADYCTRLPEWRDGLEQLF